MNSQGILIIATLIAAAITLRYFWLDIKREKRRNARLRRDVAHYRDELQSALDEIDNYQDLMIDLMGQRNSAHPTLRVINGQ
jgi:hypothetical protein